LAVEDQDEMKDWVLSIRYTKVKKKKNNNNNPSFSLSTHATPSLRATFNINIIQIE
jgi:hypothetical protein